VYRVLGSNCIGHAGEAYDNTNSVKEIH